MAAEEKMPGLAGGGALEKKEDVLERVAEAYGDIRIGGTIFFLVVMIPIAIALYLLKSIEALVLVAFGVVPVLLWWVLSNLEGKKGS